MRTVWAPRQAGGRVGNLYQGIGRGANRLGAETGQARLVVARQPACRQPACRQPACRQPACRGLGHGHMVPCTLAVGGPWLFSAAARTVQHGAGGGKLTGQRVERALVASRQGRSCRMEPPHSAARYPLRGRAAVAVYPEACLMAHASRWAARHNPFLPSDMPHPRPGQPTRSTLSLTGFRPHANLA